MTGLPGTQSKVGSVSAVTALPPPKAFSSSPHGPYLMRYFLWRNQQTPITESITEVEKEPQDSAQRTRV